LVDNPGKAYKTIRRELAAYGNGLAEKPEIVALSQADTLDADTRKKKLAALKKAAGRAPLLLSAVTGEGVEAVLRGLMSVVQEARGDAAAAAATVGDRWKRD
jgi:GTP-binding protein